MGDPAYALQAKGLCKTFGKVEALTGLDLTFEEGKMHGLIGPEGAGKTTFLRLAMGLLKATGGETGFTVDGKAVDFAAVRPKIAYMPQQQSLYADLSIAEHLEFFRTLYQVPLKTYRERREELLEVTRLGPFQDRPAGKLSGGMYKKLGLMCALLHSPRVLLLDEPTNGVDPISRREFWELLYGLLAKRILIVVATAYMDEAERCGVVHLMQSGRCLTEGEPKTLLASWGAKTTDELFLKVTGEADRARSHG